MTIIDTYVQKLTPDQKDAIERVRKIVHKKVTDIEEKIAWGMPAFYYKGKYLLGVCEFKEHLSLFPTAKPIEELKDKLTDFKIGKGTIQFTIDRPIPQTLIEDIIAIRLKQINM